jgi:hypothetical protein
MNIEQLEVFLLVAGRYQVYSDGAGGFQVLPVPVDAVLCIPESHQQLSAPPDELNYNSGQG